MVLPDVRREMASAMWMPSRSRRRESPGGTHHQGKRDAIIKGKSARCEWKIELPPREPSCRLLVLLKLAVNAAMLSGLSNSSREQETQ